MQYTREAKLISETIYDLKLIKDCLNLEEPIEFGRMIFFTIAGSKIVGTTIVNRKDFKDYAPKENEYFLDAVRDSGDWFIDFNLKPTELLKLRWEQEPFSKDWHIDLFML